MTRLPALRLKTKYPCCGQVATFVALASIPAERYARLCQRCGQKWDVLRQIKSRAAGVRIDVLTWNRAGLHPTANDRNHGERGRFVTPAGVQYTLYDAPLQGIDAGGEWSEDSQDAWKPWRWATVCETHGTVCGHPTLALARRHLSSGEWCEECR